MFVFWLKDEKSLSDSFKELEFGATVRQGLRKQGSLEGKQWLVGNKCTFADLAFATWNDRIDTLILVFPDNKFEGFSNVKSWHERMISRHSWKKAMETRAKLMDDQGLLWNGMPKGVTSMKEYEEKIKQG